MFNLDIRLEKLLFVIVCVFSISTSNAESLGQPAPPQVDTEKQYLKSAVEFGNEVIPLGKARIVVNCIGAAPFTKARIDINGQQVASLKPGEFYKTDVDVGKLKIKADSSMSPGYYELELDVQSNTVYVVNASFRYNKAAAFGLIGFAIESKNKGKNGDFSLALHDTLVSTLNQENAVKLLPEEIEKGSTKVSTTLGNQKTLLAANSDNPVKNATHEKLTPNNVIWQSKIANVPVYKNPDGITVITTLSKAEEVVSLSQEQDGYVKVISTHGDGWVMKTLLQ